MEFSRVDACVRTPPRHPPARAPPPAHPKLTRTNRTQPPKAVLLMVEIRHPTTRV